MTSVKKHNKNIRGKGLFSLDLFFTFLVNYPLFLILAVYSSMTEASFYQFGVNLAVIAGVITIANLSVGLYDAKVRDSYRVLIRRIIISFALTYMALQTLIYPLFSQYEFSQTVLLMVLLLTYLTIFYLRYLTTSSNILGYSRKKVIVIGAGERASIIHKRMRRMVDRKNFELLGFIATPKDKLEVLQNETVIQLESLDNLVEYALENEVDEIVIAPDEKRGVLPVELLFECKMRGIEIVDILDFLEDETGQIAVNMIYPSWIIYANGFHSPNYIQEVFDYILNAIIATFVLLFTWPIMIITALAIYFEDGKKTKSPIFYKQIRVGLNGERFNIVKFRSMGPDAEKNGAQWASKSDNRVTKVGHFIRKYRVDELPQLINVFKGEMCFVGPRPERPEFVSELIKESSYYNYRHNAKPGLTGWAQLKYPYGASTEDSIEKLKYDLYYIKHRSLLLDALILIRTVEIVLFGKGR